MRRLFLLIPIALFLLPSCTPTELPAPAHAAGSNLISQVNMGENYDYQIFYNLKNNAEVSRNLRSAWDLKFECGPDGFHVYLNASKFMSAWNTGKTDLQMVTDTAGFGAGQLYDAANGSLDSTAVGDWRTQKPVYIINRGADENGAFGFVKLQITNVDENGYNLVFSDLNGGAAHQVHLNKQDNYSFVFLSLDNSGSQVQIAPPKDQWDICFTQFTVKIPIPYLVTGVLLNPYNTHAARVSTPSFDSVNLNFAQQLPLSNAWDTIGYDWKEYSFDNGLYTVNTTYTYIIQTSDLTFFKLHFIDFYSDSGVKGSPKFEYESL